MENINKKSAILLSAAKIFAKDGFEKATIDEIIKGAKIAKGTVYYYFKSKEEIFGAIITEGIKNFEIEIDEAVKKETDVVGKIESFIETEKNYILKYRDFFTVFVGELIKKSKRFEKLEDIIEQGKKEKIIRNELETEFLAKAIFWMVAMTTIDGKFASQKELIIKGILR